MYGDHIRYAIDLDTGLVVSQLGNEYAWPIMDYEGIGKDGDYTGPIEYNLEKLSQHETWNQALYPTKRIPTDVKNVHRAFWGLPPVKPIANETLVLERYWKRHGKRVFG